MKKSLTILTIMLLPALALAQTLTSSTGTTAIGLSDLIESGQQTYFTFKMMGFLAGLTALTNALINLTKWEPISNLLNRKKWKWAQPLLASILGLLLGISGAAASGENAVMGAVMGFVGGGGAVVVHEIRERFKNRKEN